GGGFDVNRSLGNIFYTLLAATHAIVPTRALAWIVRVVSALILGYAGWLSRPIPGHAMSSRRQVEIGVIYLLLTCCLSPYSWFYNWALSAPAMVLFFKRVWDGNAKVAESALLVALLLSLVTTHFGMAMVSPVLGVALALTALHHMRREPSSAGHSEGALQTKLAASSELPEPT
ncbi:MAG TPA: hypothetical protein VFI20_02795, partial [Terracidiphilus sp.]|nr:hypothetical protein [Terracidiphilus sp.]